jgi:hypothetical protein
MSDTNHTSKDGGRFLTVDCDDFWLDGPGDHTVRPISTERLARAKALRDQILAAEAAKQASQDAPKC